MVSVGGKVEFVGVFAGGDELSGEQTPAGFQDTPGQWYSVTQRKRGAAGGAAATEDDGEATLRDSQETQEQSDAGAATEPMSQTEGEAKPPVFVYASGSLSDENSGGSFRHHQQRREEEEIDEDETQIIMSLSQDQYGQRTAAPSRKIEEEELVVSKTTGDAVLHSASDDDGADSDMSDDMLAHDGPIDDISTLAASFQQKDADDAEQNMKKKAPVNVYRPRTQFRQTPTHSVEENSSSSSGAETEVEEEPEGDLEEQQEPATIGTKASLRGVAHPTARFARQRSMSEHSTASEKDEDSGKKDENKNRPKRFRLDSLSHSRTLERRDSTASDTTNNGEEMPVHATTMTAAKPATGAKKPARSSPVRSKRGVAVTTNPATSRGKKLLQDEGSKDSASQSSTASPTEVVTTTMQESKIVGDDELDKPQHGLPPKPAKGKTPRKTPTAASGTPPTTGRKRRLGAFGDSDKDNEATQAQEKQIRIILTGLEPSPAIRKKIKAVGSVYEDDIEKATHVIAPKNQLKRTVKLLCGISRCDHILDEKWLNESAKAGVPLSEQDYCLLDTKAQEKWHFDLHKTMYEFTPEQRRQLFVGHTVFITNHKSVLPPVKDLVKIVECAGGKAEVKGGAGPSDLVITSEAALSVLSVQKSLAGANPQRIYSPELILSSILQQHIDLGSNRLEFHAAKTSSTPTKKRVYK